MAHSLNQMTNNAIYILVLVLQSLIHAYSRSIGFPTEYRHDDHTEVKDIPRLFEVVEPQTDEFHDALEGEDGDEDLVDDIQDVCQ